MLTRPVVESLAVLSSFGSPAVTAAFFVQSIACHGVRMVATWSPELHNCTRAGCRLLGAVASVPVFAFSTTVPVMPFWLPRPALFNTLETDAVSVWGRLKVSLYDAPPSAPEMPCATAMKKSQPTMTHTRCLTAKLASVFILDLSRHRDVAKPRARVDQLT